MKVLEPGSPQSGWAVETKCTGAGNNGGGCGAKLLVEKGDLYQTHKYGHDLDHDIFPTFRCSQCGVETDLRGLEVPNNILRSLPSKEPERS